MRTIIDIDDTLMADALALTQSKSKRALVELALKTVIRLKKQEKIRGLEGKLPWDGGLDAMRCNG